MSIIKGKNLGKREWSEFREAKMFWFINRIIHIFGWAIALEMKDDIITDVYPIRTKYRGFSEKSESDGFIGITEYMLENAEELLKEAKDET